ncbi:hypothetical protein NCCP2716_22350 [Sporosarcina sp. NCCP-2716]|uniref:DUF4097 family beta strand repeat-containing protein n=1 Tax=Sporosarcina sp. NCCP-2716 TaxID=2943679 RepID=UPI0020424AFB|nr:DUF4097 family beta strand repeat-containing protein [Sporosarcina sp. NCCP-2716]GKV69737.1 hypothetical protein NCCP2716_22350 [Sporosarcina sp. NCCP-2716]
MTENRYIAELERLLDRLPADEQRDIVQDIREYFADGHLDGKSDEEITASLGSPLSIAQELLAGYPEPSQTVHPDTAESIRIENSDYQDIAMDVHHGSLLVSPSDNHVTTVELLNGNDKVKLTAEVIGSTLQVKLTSLRPRFLMFGFIGKDVLVKVSLPKKLYGTIGLKTDNGRIAAEKILCQSLRLKSNNGRILLREAAARQLVVTTDNGRIGIANTQADRVHAKTDNGRIEMNHVDSETLSVETDNGRIELHHVDGHITGETDNGRIELMTDILDRNIDLKTDNGSILIQADDEPHNVTIQAKTDHGRIDIFGEKNSRTIFGPGENSIKLKSANGRITVR